MSRGSGRLRATLATLSGSWVNLVVISIQAVVLVPLYLKYIGPRLYGAWLGSGDFLVWMQALDLGLPNLMIQRIGAAHGREDVDAVVEHFSSAALALFCVACLLMIAFWAISTGLPDWMQLVGAEARELRQSFLIGVLATGILIANNSVVGLARGVQDTLFINAMVVLSSIIGFGVTLLLILQGTGLRAIALGLLARAIISFLGSLFFAFDFFRSLGVRSLKVRLSVLREYYKILPATGIAGLSYALMNQSEAALIAVFVRPELATIFTLTRRAVDVAKSLVDAIGFAVYGSFAHLVASEEKYKAGSTFVEINSLRLSLSVAFAAAYMAVNQSLVSLWAGAAQYGGSLLTILLGIRFIVNGSSYLVNYLYRATGEIVRGSLMLLAEGLVRVALTIGFLLLLGIEGVPLAGMVTATFFGVLVYRWTVQKLSLFSKFKVSPSPSVWVMHFALLIVGAVGALLVQMRSWVYVLGVGGLLVVVGAGALIWVDPRLRITRSSIRTLLVRLATEITI